MQQIKKLIEIKFQNFNFKNSISNSFKNGTIIFTTINFINKILILLNFRNFKISMKWSLEMGFPIKI